MKNKVNALETLINVIYWKLAIELGMGMGGRTVGKIVGWKSRQILHADCSIRVF